MPRHSGGCGRCPSSSPACTTRHCTESAVRWRRFAVIAGAVAALIVVAVVLMLGRLDSVVRRTIEERGSALTQTAVRVGSVHVALQDGTATLRDLTIANPPGFQAENAFELKEITVQLALDSLT